MPVKTEVPNAVIGGTGFSDRVSDYSVVKTDYGPIKIGEMELGGKRVKFVSRHSGLEVPHLVNYKGIMQALKLSDVNTVLAVSACGRLAESVWPGHLIAVSDIDWDDAQRDMSYADNPGLLLHASMNEPFSSQLRQLMIDSWEEAMPKIEEIYRGSPDLRVGFHDDGTYFNIKGPAFTTPAREERLRNDVVNAKVIGQTLVDEVHLAREMAMAYAAVGMCVDHSNFPGGIPVAHADGVMHAVTKTADAAVALLDVTVRKIPDNFFEPVSHGAFDHSFHSGQADLKMLRSNGRTNLAVILENVLAARTTA